MTHATQTVATATGRSQAVAGALVLSDPETSLSGGSPGFRDHQTEPVPDPVPPPSMAVSGAMGVVARVLDADGCALFFRSAQHASFRRVASLGSILAADDASHALPMFGGGEHSAWACAPDAASGAEILRAVVVRNQSGTLLLEARRRPERGPFAAAALGLLTRMLPPLADVLESALSSESVSSLADYTFNRLPFGLTLVDAHRRIAEPNTALRRMLACGDGLYLESQTLRVRSAEDHQSFVLALATVLEGRAECSSLLILSRGSERPPYQAFIERFEAPPRAGPLCRLVVVDPLGIDVATVMRLGRRYRLTPTEARVVHAFLSGLGSAQCAQALDLTTQTLDWYVKQVLAKTGVKSRAEVLLLFARVTQISQRAASAIGVYFSIPPILEATSLFRAL